MVPILNDMVPEKLEYFSLALMANDPAVALNPATTYIIVVDDIDGMLKPPDVFNFAISFSCQYTVEIVFFPGFSDHNWIEPSNLFCS